MVRAQSSYPATPAMSNEDWRALREELRCFFVAATRASISGV